MASTLVSELHGDALRFIANKINVHHNGLRSAAAYCRRQKLLPANLIKKLGRLDDAFVVTRHITSVYSASFLQELEAELVPEVPPHRPAADATTSISKKVKFNDSVTDILTENQSPVSDDGLAEMEHKFNESVYAFFKGFFEDLTVKFPASWPLIAGMSEEQGCEAIKNEAQSRFSARIKTKVAREEVSKKIMETVRGAIADRCDQGLAAWKILVMLNTSRAASSATRSASNEPDELKRPAKLQGISQ